MSPARGSQAAPQQQLPVEEDSLDQIYGAVNEDGDVEVMDLSSVDEEGTFTLIPAGTYDAVIDDIEYIRANSKGQPMLTWKLSITEEPYAGRKMRYYTTLNDPDPEKRTNALARLRRTIRRVAPAFNIGEFRPLEAAGVFAGLPCRLKITQEADRQNPSKKRNNVSDLIQPSEDSGGFLD